MKKGTEMTHQDREAILALLLSVSEAKAGEYKYAHAFGVLSALVPDSSLEELGRHLESIREAL